jgi:hypothetical protein
LYWSGVTAAEDVPAPFVELEAKGRKAIFSSARSISRPYRPAGGSTLIRPICFRYSGVIERATKSPMASWKPSFAPFLNRRSWFL